MRNLGYAFCAGHVLKTCATCSVVCEIWGGVDMHACTMVKERSKRLLRRERGGRGEKRTGGEGRYCLRADHGIGTWKIDGVFYTPSAYIKGQIGGFFLHKLYHGCSPYDFC